MIRDRRKGPRKLADFGPANVWFCDRCREHGAANLELSLTVFEAVERIRSAHKRQSPACIGGTAYIRVVNLQELKSKGLVA
jgi:hypothetical protein